MLRREVKSTLDPGLRSPVVVPDLVPAGRTVGARDGPGVPLLVAAPVDRNTLADECLGGAPLPFRRRHVLRLGSGRIVGSEIEAPDMLAIPV